MAVSTKKTTSKKEIVEDKTKQRCPMCGKEKLRRTYFYKSSSKLFKGNDGYMCHCKDCMCEEYDNHFEILKDERNALKSICMQFNISYDDKTFDIALTRTKTAEEDYEKTGKRSANSLNLFKNYMTVLNSLSVNGYISDNKVQDDFGSVNVVCEMTGTEKPESEMTPQEKMTKIQSEAKMTEEEETAKNDCINMLSYDPFLGSSIFDQKYLYMSLLPYLDEDTMDDSFKISQVMQIVNNNNQVRKIDLIINIMSSDVKTMLSNQSDIKSLTQTKKQIVDNTDKIAKENGISVKNRGDKKAGKSTLTYLMKNLRELNFDDAEADYYDEQKCYGMYCASKASTEALFGQLALDENDWNDIFKMNKELVDKLYKEVDELKEENRQLNIKLSQAGDN